jgi:hypothetical protein
MSENYNKEEIAHDLFLMVKAGLLEVHIREDGEWVYSPSKKSLVMSDEEKMKILENLSQYEDEEYQ